MKLSILGLLNFTILQWFFIRLGKIINTETKKITGWTIIKWIVPLTGWWNDYISIGAEKK